MWWNIRYQKSCYIKCKVPEYAKICLPVYFVLFFAPRGKQLESDGEGWKQTNREKITQTRFLIWTLYPSFTFVFNLSRQDNLFYKRSGILIGNDRVFTFISIINLRCDGNTKLNYIPL